MKRLRASQGKESTQLSAQAWTRAALERLAAEGIDGVRVEVLAKDLGVTKGSFYWHFKDRSALYEAMLSDWRRRATLQLIERLDRGEISPRDRVARLLTLPVQGLRSPAAAEVELAIRLWGRRDETARRALEEVDALRVAYIERLMNDCGYSGQDARARAIVAYSYMRVAATLVPADAKELLDACVRIIAGN